MLYSYPAALFAAFIEQHNTDLPGAAFKIGQSVMVDLGAKAPSLEPFVGVVAAVNLAYVENRRPLYEYALVDFTAMLLWEDELSAIVTGQ